MVERSPDDAPHRPEPGDRSPTRSPGGDPSVRPSAPPPVDLLAAEQAAAAYWRQVAGQRRVDAAQVQRRPIVRAAIAADRGTRRLQDRVVDEAGRVVALGRRTRLVGAGLLRRPVLHRRRRALDDQRAATPAPPPTDGRAILLVPLDDPPAVGAAPAAPARTTPLPAPEGVTVERTELLDVGRGPNAVADATLLDLIDRAVEASTAPLVCLVGAGVRPTSGDWLAHLAGAVGNGVVAATPLVVKGPGAWTSATTVDLLVRAAGLDVALQPGHDPVVVARDVGRRADPSAPSRDVAGATAAALLVDRRAWSAAGGLLGGRPPDGVGEHRSGGRRAAGRRSIGRRADSTAGLDEAVMDLCLRLRAQGGRIQVVPAAVVIEDRPVHVRRELTEPVDPQGAAWRGMVEAHGSALARMARTGRTGTGGAGGTRPTVAVSTATPSRKMARWSGDWHFAGDLAGALDRAGYDVRLQSAEEADSLVGRTRDLHLVLRGLEPVRRTHGQRHVLWIISHPEAVTIAECDQADLVLVASERFAAYLAERTSTPVAVLWQATEPRRFRPVPVQAEHRHPVTVVANTRGVSRRAVTDALAAGLTPAVYGQGWTDQIDPALIASDYVDPAELPAVYSSAQVVLNDHWDTMAHWGFVSNRIFDVLACATPVVSDHLAELAGLFGRLVPTWRDPEELRGTVDTLLADPRAAAALATEARDLVLAGHTFDHRVAEMEGLLGRHGLALRESEEPAPVAAEDAVTKGGSAEGAEAEGAEAEAT